MRIYTILPLLLLGCGASNNPPTDGSGNVHEPAPVASASASAQAPASLPPGVEARLGCIDITTEQVNQELALQKRLSKEPLTREVVLGRLVRMAVAADYARAQGMSVDAADVDTILERVAKENGLTVEQVFAEVRAAGVDDAYYRTALRDQLLEMKVRMRLVPDAKDIETLTQKSDVELDRLRAELAARQTYRTEKGCSETPPG
ncbi:MAG: hypothetical protein HOV80_09765 [Polyangiaceae bacterium]|nr:hypothetical protein [Polyangiaceae bacterium]